MIDFVTVYMFGLQRVSLRELEKCWNRCVHGMAEYGPQRYVQYFVAAPE